VVYRLRWQPALLMLLAASAASGCVRRRLTVRTNPPGAMVYVDRQLIGPSPASTSFTYYGTRHIEVVGDGYRTEKVLRTIRPPWYQIPPLDFFAETLWPWEIRDQRVIDITMVPEPEVASSELIARGEQLRTQAAMGIATPLGAQAGGAPAGQILPPGGTVPNVPPTANPYAIAPVYPPAAPAAPWRPGQLLRGFFQPGGQPVQSIPEVQGLQGGGYRPDLGS
jgi:hypothetical protein